MCSLRRFKMFTSSSVITLISVSHNIQSIIYISTNDIAYTAIRDDYALCIQWWALIKMIVKDYVILNHKWLVFFYLTFNHAFIIIISSKIKNTQKRIREEWKTWHYPLMSVMVATETMIPGLCVRLVGSFKSIWSSCFGRFWRLMIIFSFGFADLCLSPLPHRLQDSDIACIVS